MLSILLSSVLKGRQSLLQNWVTTQCFHVGNKCAAYDEPPSIYTLEIRNEKTSTWVQVDKIPRCSKPHNFFLHDFCPLPFQWRNGTDSTAI